MTAIERDAPAPFDSLDSASCLTEGARALAAGAFDDAIGAFESALRLAPQDPVGFTGLGGAYLAKGLSAPAIECYRRALALDEGRARTWLEMAYALHALGNHPEAVVAAERAAELDDGLGEAYLLIGASCLSIERHDVAQRAFAEAERVMPWTAAPLKGAGTACFRSGDWAGARERFARALQLAPDDVETLNNLAAAELQLGRPDRAIEMLDRSLAIEPANAIALGNRSLALSHVGRYDEALETARTGERLAPESIAVLMPLAAALLGHNRHDESLDVYRRIAARQPGNWEAHFGIALSLLVAGRWGEAWSEYDWRIGHDPSAASAPNGAPRWSGEPIGGKTLLVHTEQGAGDAIQAFRYVPLLAARGVDVVLQVQPALRALFERMVGPRLVIAVGDPVPPTDFSVPMLGLPGAFGTTVETIPSEPRYLSPASERVRAMSAALPKTAGLLVGLAWSGNPKHRADRSRSMALAALAPLFEVAGVQWVGLQAEATDADRAVIEATPNLVHLGPQPGGFDDLAAIVEQLDLVVTVDTAFAHLGGALGVPTWTMIAYAPDWRWLLGREDTPWYPSMRLFRQRSIGDWAPVVAKVRAELEAHRVRTPRALIDDGEHRRSPRAHGRRR